MRTWVSVKVTGDPMGWLTIDTAVPAVEKIRRELLDRWKQEAASKIRNPTMLQRFEDAMQVRVVKLAGAGDGKARRGALRFTFSVAGPRPSDPKGMWGPAIEYGWAPTGKTWADGVGQYDGGIHDLREFILGDGRKYRRVAIYNSLGTSTPKHGGGSPLDYLIAKMKQATTPAMKGEPGAKYAARHTKYAKKLLTSDKRLATINRQVEKVLRSAAEQRDAPLGINDLSKNPENWMEFKGGNVMIAAKRRLGTGKKEDDAYHAHSMSKRAYLVKATRSRGGGGGNAMLTIRTISWNERSMANGTWRTRGIEPADTIPEMLEVAVATLRTALWEATEKRKNG